MDFQDVLKKIKRIYLKSDGVSHIDKICSLIIEKNENPDLIISNDALKNLLTVYLNNSVHYKKFETYLVELLKFIFEQQEDRCLNCNNLLFRAFASKQNMLGKTYSYDGYCLNCGKKHHIIITNEGKEINESEEFKYA